MEREMCQYLDWESNVDRAECEAMVRKDFAGPGLYPTNVPQTISNLVRTSTNPFPAMSPEEQHKSHPILRHPSSVATRVFRSNLDQL